MSSHFTMQPAIVPLPADAQVEAEIDTTRRATVALQGQLDQLIGWAAQQPDSWGAREIACTQAAKLGTALARLQLAHAVGALALTRMRGGAVSTHRIEVRRFGAASEIEAIAEK